MPRKRSRPKTEEKFQDAVLDLVARDGCGGLGINAVAQEAGADKVLIYRYFGDFKGLLLTVAKSRQWLPTGEEVYQAIPAGESHAATTLRQIEEGLLHHIRADACTLQLVRWRRAKICPICDQFTQEWQSLWKALPLLLTAELNSEQRSHWKQACALLALIIEAELCGEAIDRQSLAHVAEGLGLARVKIEQSTDKFSVSAVEISLPTNLL